MATLRKGFWIIHILFFIFFYFYILFVVDPACYYLHHNPGFFTHYDFFSRFLIYPGGPVDYVSLFLTELSFVPWIGALATTGVVLTITLLTIKLLIISGIKKVFPFISLLPAILLTGLHGNFGHPFHYDLKLVLMLFVYTHYRANRRRNPVTDIPVLLVLSGLLLYAGGIIPFGLFLLMTIIESIFEQKGQTRIIRSIAALVIAPLLPYLFYNFIFMRGLYFEWQGLRDLLQSYTVTVIPIVPLIFFPLLVASIPLAKKAVASFSRNDKNKTFHISKGISFLSNNSLIVHVVLICLLTILMHSMVYDSHYKKYYRMRKLADQKKWPEVISVSEKCTPNDVAVHLVRNRALYHSGKLLDHMFDFPQKWGVDGLMYSQEGNDSRLFIPFSNIAFDMGEVNQSIRCVYEEIAHYGYSKHALKRLILVNIIKGNYPTAEKLLHMLQRTPFQKQWSDTHLKLVEDPGLIKYNAEIMEKRDLLPHKIFSHKDNIPHLTILINLLFNNKNKMAFEYTMMCLLLDMKLDDFVSYLRLMEKFSYTRMPRHFQEALCVYLMIRPDTEGVINRYLIEPGTTRQFKEFNDIKFNQGGEKDATRKKLQEQFGDTYWFYMHYLLPGYRAMKKKKVMEPQEQLYIQKDD